MADEWIIDVYRYNGIFLNHKKERNPDLGYNMDEYWGHHAKRNKPVPKKQTAYDFTYMRYQE